MNIENFFEKIIDNAKKDKYSFIDISKLNLLEIPDFTKCINYKLIKNIKYLFASHNNIEKVEKKNFDQFPNLTVVDLSFNKITSVKYLPNTLNQLSINNNNIRELPYIKDLVLLEASNNKITSIPHYEKLHDLYIDSNRLTELETFDDLFYVTCRKNDIRKINSQPNLFHLNCAFNNLGKSNTKISDPTKKISGMPKLKHLICTNNPHLNGFDKDIKILETFEFADTNILNLPYISTLKHIVCSSKNGELIISEKYSLKNVVTNKYTYSISIEFR